MSFNSELDLTFFTGSIIGLVGQIFIVRVFVSSYRKSNNSGIVAAYGLAFLIGILPGLLWHLQLSPETVTSLANTEFYPVVERVFSTSYLMYLGAEKLIAIPFASLIAVVGLKG